MQKSRLYLAFFLIINCSLSIINCNAQPNPGFENWSIAYGLEEPDNWQTYNFLALLSPPNPLSAFKAIGVDAHTGNYALKLTTIHVINNPVPSEIHDTMSGTYTGKINLSPLTYFYGSPYTGRPANLDFWAKYAPVGSDTAGAFVVLLKWNGISRDTIASGRITIPATSTYTLFHVPLTYYLTEQPDSAMIAFLSSYAYGTPSRVGSTLFIDDVAYTGWVGINQLSIDNNQVSVYPNPAKNNITIHAQINEADNVQLIDASGNKLAGIYKIQNYNANINTDTFATAIYFYEIRDKTNCILTTGKFNVIK